MRSVVKGGVAGLGGEALPSTTSRAVKHRSMALGSATAAWPILANWALVSAACSSLNASYLSKKCRL